VVLSIVTAVSSIIVPSLFVGVWVWAWSGILPTGITILFGGVVVVDKDVLEDVELIEVDILVLALIEVDVEREVELVDRLVDVEILEEVEEVLILIDVDVEREVDEVLREVEVL
jgi:hypothetical protein